MVKSYNRKGFGFIMCQAGAIERVFGGVSGVCCRFLGFIGLYRGYLGFLGFGVRLFFSVFL